MAILSLGFLSFPIATFFAALYFQDVWHFSALETAVHLLPMAVMGISVNVIAKPVANWAVGLTKF